MFYYIPCKIIVMSTKNKDWNSNSTCFLFGKLFWDFFLAWMNRFVPIQFPCSFRLRLSSVTWVGFLTPNISPIVVVSHSLVPSCFWTVCSEISLDYRDACVDYWASSVRLVARVRKHVLKRSYRVMRIWRWDHNEMERVSAMARWQVTLKRY